jgi:hypothetical protein
VKEVGRSFGVVMSKRGFGVNKCCIIYGLGFIWLFQKRVYDVFCRISAASCHSAPSVLPRI